jgi:hypothetical protein
LHWLLKYLKGRNFNDQFDNRFTLVPRYPRPQHFSQQFVPLKIPTWEGIAICGMIRTLPVNGAPLLSGLQMTGRLGRKQFRMTCWYMNPIRYTNKRFIRFILQWTLL